MKPTPELLSLYKEVKACVDELVSSGFGFPNQYKRVFREVPPGDFIGEMKDATLGFTVKPGAALPDVAASVFGLVKGIRELREYEAFDILHQLEVSDVYRPLTAETLDTANKLLGVSALLVVPVNLIDVAHRASIEDEDRYFVVDYLMGPWNWFVVAENSSLVWAEEMPLNLEVILDAEGGNVLVKASDRCGFGGGDFHGVVASVKEKAALQSPGKRSQGLEAIP